MEELVICMTIGDNTSLLKKSLALGAFLTLMAPAQADVYIQNTTDERMTYQVKLPNGDTQDGIIAPYDGYYPVQTSIPGESGKVVSFKIVSESGQSSVEAKGSYSQTFVLFKKDGVMQFKPVSWSMDNGQTHKRAVTILNATGEPQEFSLIDEKEMRPLKLAPGEMINVPAKNGFGGSSGFHHLKFANGDRLDNAISAGTFNILYLDKRSPGKVQVDDYGYLAVPNGIKP